MGPFAAACLANRSGPTETGGEPNIAPGAAACPAHSLATAENGVETPEEITVVCLVNTAALLETATFAIAVLSPTACLGLGADTVMQSNAAACPAQPPVFFGHGHLSGIDTSTAATSSAAPASHEYESSQLFQHLAKSMAFSVASVIFDHLLLWLEGAHVQELVHE